MIQKIKNKIKKFLSSIFSKDSLEKGVAATTVIGVIMLTIGTIGVIYKYTDWFGDIGTFGVKQLMGLIYWISKLAFRISANIFEGIYNLDILQTPMTRGTGIIAGVVLHGWAIVRDFANMFIVLGFVVIGLATILRIREYEAQKKLLPLIIVALLINFSLVITGIVIDASNITMRYFTQISGPTTIIETYRDILDNDSVYNDIDKYIKQAGGDNMKKIEAYVMGFGSVVVFTGVIAMIFFIYGILFLFRYVALMCLVILSPLAFVCSVFPVTRQIYDKWKSQFIQWAIIGIPTAFFVYLGTFLLVSMKNANMLSSGPGTGPGPVSVSLAFWVPTAFLLFAYSLIFQTSAIGAQAAIGLATGAVGYAMGASRWVGGKAWAGTKAVGGASAKAVGADAITQRMGSNWGKFKEKLRLSPTGTQAAKDYKRVQEEGKNFEAAYYTDPAAKARIQGWAKNGTGARGAAAMEMVARANDLSDVFKDSSGRVDLNAMAGRVVYAQQQGVNRKIFTDKDPRLERHNEPKIQELMTKYGLSRDKAELRAIKDVVNKTAPSKAAEWSPDIIESPEVFMNLSKSQLIEGGKRGTPGWVNAAKKFRRGRDPITGAAYTNPLDPRQSAEYRALYNHINTNFGLTSPEGKNTTELLNEMETNSVFK